MHTLLLACFAAASALAAPGDPLVDLTGQVYGGTGYAVSRGDGMDVLGRAGAAATLWLAPSAGLGLRADAGNYGLFGDEANAFVFAEARYFLAGPGIVVSAGVWSPVVWVEYYCLDATCPQGPWERHDPIATVSAGRELTLGPLFLPVTLRAEASAVRAGLGIDVGMGWRLRRS